jgi:hypothetical protein
MKIAPRRAPLAAAHQDDSTPEFEGGAGPKVYRRTTVTVERETVLVLIRRSVLAPVDPPKESEDTQQRLDKTRPAASP